MWLLCWWERKPILSKVENYCQHLYFIYRQNFQFSSLVLQINSGNIKSAASCGRPLHFSGCLAQRRRWASNEKKSISLQGCRFVTYQQFFTYFMKNALKLKFLITAHHTIRQDFENSECKTQTFPKTGSAFHIQLIMKLRKFGSANWKLGVQKGIALLAV